MSAPFLLALVFYFFLYNFFIAQCCDSDCTYETWKSWSCTCDNATQIRIRDMCCPGGVTTREECAVKCHMSLNWQEYVTCEKCLNGGVFDHQHKKCICPPTHRGRFCCDAVKCNEKPCKHGQCNDTVSPFFCVCEPGYTGVVCDKEIQGPLPWWPYLEYGIISLGGLVTLVAFGCACFRLGKQLRCLSKNRKEKRKNHKISKENKRRIQRSQVKPSSIDF